MSHATSPSAHLFGASCDRCPRLTMGSALLAGLTAVAVLVACGKSPTPPATVEAKPKPKATLQTPAPRAEAATAPQEESEPLSAEEQASEDRADEIMAAHPDMTAQDLLNVPEVNTKLRDFLVAVSKSPEFQARINSSIAFAAAMKNLQGNKDNWQFSMDLKGYDKQRTRRLLSSLLSAKPTRVLDFFEREVTEATSEFTFDPSSPKSQNGISLEPKSPPPPKEE